MTPLVVLVNGKTLAWYPGNMRCSGAGATVRIPGNQTPVGSQNPPAQVNRLSASFQQKLQYYSPQADTEAPTNCKGDDELLAAARCHKDYPKRPPAETHRIATPKRAGTTERKAKTSFSSGTIPQHSVAAFRPRRPHFPRQRCRIVTSYRNDYRNL